MITTRLGTALLSAALVSCAALLRTGNEDVDRQTEEYMRYHGPDGYVIEGEIRDFATFAVARDAVLHTSSDVPGYQPKGQVDDRGHFQVTVVVRQKRNNWFEQMYTGVLFGDPLAGETRVLEVAFRARSGRRCSPVFRSRLDSLPPGLIVLWLQECTEKDLARQP